MTEQQPPTVCQHGSLQRACLVCEVTAERDTALQLVSEMRHAEDILHRTLDTVCAERDAAERNEREYRAACEMSIGALRDSRERWEQRAVLAEAERDAARAASQNAHECLFETEQSLSEARRVLRAQDECMVCKAELFRDLTVPHCFDCVVEDEHAEEWDAICAAKAAVLAQDTDA